MAGKVPGANLTLLFKVGEVEWVRVREIGAMAMGATHTPAPPWKCQALESRFPCEKKGFS